MSHTSGLGVGLDTRRQTGSRYQTHSVLSSSEHHVSIDFIHLLLQLNGVTRTNCIFLSSSSVLYCHCVGFTLANIQKQVWVLGCCWWCCRKLNTEWIMIFLLSDWDAATEAEFFHWFVKLFLSHFSQPLIYWIINLKPRIMQLRACVCVCVWCRSVSSVECHETPCKHSVRGRERKKKVEINK